MCNNVPEEGGFNLYVYKISNNIIQIFISKSGNIYKRIIEDTWIRLLTDNDLGFLFERITELESRIQMLEGEDDALEMM